MYDTSLYLVHILFNNRHMFNLVTLSVNHYNIFKELKDADMVAVCFDYTDDVSYNNTEMWYEMVKEANDGR